MERVTHITLFVDCGDYGRHSTFTYPSGLLYLDIHHVMDVFATHSLSLNSIKTALRFKGRTALRTSDAPHAHFEAKEFLPRPAPTVAHLSLVQHVDAYRLSHNLVWTANRDSFFLNYVPTELGCYVWAKNDNVAPYWTKEKIVEEWPNTKFAVPDLNNDLECARIDGLPYTFGGWREKRGRECAQV